MLANECVRRSEAEVRAGLLKIWSVMAECIAARVLHTRSASRRPQGTASRRPIYTSGSIRERGQQ